MSASNMSEMSSNDQCTLAVIIAVITYYIMLLFRD